jgi:hypothetical protein
MRQKPNSNWLKHHWGNLLSHITDKHGWTQGLELPLSSPLHAPPHWLFSGGFCLLHLGPTSLTSRREPCRLNWPNKNSLSRLPRPGLMESVTTIRVWKALTARPPMEPAPGKRYFSSKADVYMVRKEQMWGWPKHTEFIIVGIGVCT